MMKGWLAYVLVAACSGSTTDETGPTGETGSTPTGPTVTSIASSFGECIGPCRSTLTFTPATLTISDYQGSTVVTEQPGALTTAGAAELAAVAADLAALKLQEVYGCPDCADGGAMQLVLDQAGVESEHSWEFGNPPEVLARADALFNELAVALVACKAAAWVEPAKGCEPFLL